MDQIDINQILIFRNLITINLVGLIGFYYSVWRHHSNLCCPNRREVIIQKLGDGPGEKLTPPPSPMTTNFRQNFNPARSNRVRSTFPFRNSRCVPNKSRTLNFFLHHFRSIMISGSHILSSSSSSSSSLSSSCQIIASIPARARWAFHWLLIQFPFQTHATGERGNLSNISEELFFRPGSKFFCSVTSNEHDFFRPTPESNCWNCRRPSSARWKGGREAQTTKPENTSGKVGRGSNYRRGPGCQKFKSNLAVCQSNNSSDGLYNEKVSQTNKPICVSRLLDPRSALKEHDLNTLKFLKLLERDSIPGKSLITGDDWWFMFCSVPSCFSLCQTLFLQRKHCWFCCWWRGEINESS